MLHLGTRRTHIVALALVALWALILILVYLFVRNDPSQPTQTIRTVDGDVRVIQVHRYIQPIAE